MMMMYPKTVKYLFGSLLKRSGYHEQPLVFKPFYAALVLWGCILLAIPVCSMVVKCLEPMGVVVR
jgi:hypothetical protein